MQSHSLTAVRLPDLTPLWVDSIELAADAESTGWSATLNGRTELLALLEQTGPEPTQLRITLDGMVWDLAVTGRRRNRQFGLWSASVTARSLSAWLGEPHLPDSGWLNAAPATAQQVIEEALFATGVALDWQCTDWTIPAGVWSHTGTPMSVVRRVADSIGALVQSPRAGAVVAVMPRYPSLPWEWPVTLPDVTIALDALEFEGDERVDKPAYEGVYVSSQTQGGLWLVARTGTAPALLMPTVTDPLVVAIEAASQRGGALLGAAGPQSTMTLTLPVLTGPGEPGVIDPGNLVLVPDPDGAWKGLVRSTRVRANFGDEVSQTLTIERHL